MAISLELKNIQHIYNGKKILDVPLLTIEKGSIYSIVGPNGSGKTTLLSIMSLVLQPTRGIVYFQGKPVKQNSSSLLAIQRSMTMVFQNPYLFNMSVGKNVAYGLNARGIVKKEREAKVKHALELVGLKGFEKRSARELSGGETQLVALARALVLDPAILFLDEPTANIDLQHIQKFEKIILEINKDQGKTILLTTHNLSQAYHLTENVFSLFNGVLVNSAVHNLFAGSIRKTEKGYQFKTGEAHIWISPDSDSLNATHSVINPEHIIISQEPFNSSARNQYKGIINHIGAQGEKIFLSVKSNISFNVLITKESFNKMNLTFGSEVYLTFKASSVHLL